MTVRVATVLSAREWEPALVAHANQTAALRIVLRAFQPRDIESHAEDVDVVVAGGDVTWVTPRQIAVWRRLGLGVVGLHPPTDDPAASMLELGGASEVLPDTTDTMSLVQAIRFVAPIERGSAELTRGTVTGVFGTRGAPGCTEIACALATTRAASKRTLLIDADLAAPALAVRLGVAPRPDLVDTADAVRSEGTFDRSCVRSLGNLDVVTGSHRDEGSPLRPQMLAEVIEAGAALYEHVVVDLGSGRMPEEVLEILDEVVLVVEATPVGIVRAATTAKEWFGPTPALVVNKVPQRSRSEVVDAARRWTGLDPVAVIPLRHRIQRSAASGRPPERTLVRALAGVGGG